MYSETYLHVCDCCSVAEEQTDFFSVIFKIRVLPLLPPSPQRQVVPKENVKIIKQEIAFLVSVTGVVCEGVRVVYDVTVYCVRV